MHRTLELLKEAVGAGPLLRVQASWAATAVGNWGFFIVLAVYAYDAGGPAAVGVAAFARMIPAAFAAPFTSMLGDRLARRDVLAGCALARAGFLAAIAIAVAAGAPLSAVLVLAAAFTVVTTAVRPAYCALIPELAQTPQQVAAANSVWTAIDNLGFLLGALGGGFLAAAAGYPAAFAIVGVAFGASAALVLTVPRGERPAHRDAVPNARIAREALSGAREIAREPRLRLVLGVSTAMTVVEGCADVLIVLCALELLDAGDGGVGVLNAGWAVGGIAGGVVALALLRRGRLASGLGLGALLVAAGLVGLGAWPTLAGGLLLLAVLGVGYTLVEVAVSTLLQRLASDAVLARAFGVMETSYVAATGIGSLLAPALAAAFGVRGALLVTGGFVVVVVLVTRVALGRLEAGVPVPEHAYAALRAGPMFAPLPPAVVETLALRAEPVAVADGEVLIRQGDAGGRVYIIDRGAFDVEIDGKLVATRFAPDCVGEIALLRDIPRTATVRARGPGALYRLERDAFLDSVGAHPRCLAVADAIIDGRVGAR